MCSLERIGDVYVLRFTGELDEHRFNPAFCNEIIEKLAIVKNSDAKALITTNDGKFYSNGLDLAWVAKDPSTRSQPQSEAFNILVDSFMRLNMPTIAAICGHAAAGGFILALAHDHRHMYLDRGLLYMSEMDVRILIPPNLMTLIRYKLNARAFKEVVLRASKLPPQTALELGVLDATHPTPAATLAAAMADATQLVNRKWDRDFYLSMRLAMYPDFKLRDRFAEPLAKL